MKLEDVEAVVIRLLALVKDRAGSHVHVEVGNVKVIVGWEVSREVGAPPSVTTPAEAVPSTVTVPEPANEPAPWPPCRFCGEPSVAVSEYGVYRCGSVSQCLMNTAKKHVFDAGSRNRAPCGVLCTSDGKCIAHPDSPEKCLPPDEKAPCGADYYLRDVCSVHMADKEACATPPKVLTAWSSCGAPKVGGLCTVHGSDSDACLRDLSF